MNATCTAESVAWRLWVKGTVNSVQAYCRFAMAIIATIPAPSCHQRPTRKPPRLGTSPVIEPLSAAASHERAAAAPPIVHDKTSLDCQRVADPAGTRQRAVGARASWRRSGAALPGAGSLRAANYLYGKRGAGFASIPPSISASSWLFWTSF